MKAQEKVAANVAAVFRQQAERCDEEALRDHARERGEPTYSRPRWHELAVINQAKAETLRWCAERLEREVGL